MPSARAIPLRPDPALPSGNSSTGAPARIVCGTDFSDGARAAVDVAAAMSRRLGVPLTLLHAVNEPSRDALPAELRETLALFERKHLHDETERLAASGLAAREDLRFGLPHEALLDAAREPGTPLLVVASGRQAPGGPPMLGDVAERVAETSPAPVLVLRAPERLSEWLAGRQPLRLFVAADLSPPSEAAIRWALWLNSLGRCSLIIAHIESEPTEAMALYRYASPPLQSVCEDVRRSEARCFRQFVRKLLRDEPARLHAAGGWGRSDAHLIHLAQQERADLIVTGTHQRHGVERLLHRSVSRGLLHYAPTNVACVPWPR